MLCQLHPHTHLCTFCSTEASYATWLASDVVRCSWKVRYWEQGCLEFLLADFPQYAKHMEVAIEGKWICAGEAHHYSSKDYPRQPPILHVAGVWNAQRIPLLRDCLRQLETRDSCWWNTTITAERYAEVYTVRNEAKKNLQG
jgi:hypothetical protein